MEKNRKRAIRRHHRKRLIKNRQHYWGYGTVDWIGRPNKMDPTLYNTVVNTPCPCSCFACGNARRKHNEITKAEHIADLNWVDQCREVGYAVKGNIRKVFKDYY